MNFKNFKNFITTRGFTLIETLTALLIFSTSVVVLISVTSQGLSNTNYAKNKLTASYLAQEGVEIVRNARDSALIWDDFFADPQVPQDPDCQNCFISGTPSSFDRTVTVIPESGGVKVESRVGWDQGITQKDVTYVEYLFNWQ